MVRLMQSCQISLFLWIYHTETNVIYQSDSTISTPIIIYRKSNKNHDKLCGILMMRRAAVNWNLYTSFAVKRPVLN